MKCKSHVTRGTEHQVSENLKSENIKWDFTICPI